MVYNYYYYLYYIKKELERFMISSARLVVNMIIKKEC